MSQKVGILPTVLLENNVSLVVEDDIGFPDFVIRKSQDLNATKVRGVPCQMRVVPHLAQPAIDGENLVLLVHIDDVMNGHSKMHHDGLRGVADGPHTRLVVDQ